ncbi:MAG TPA: rhodanese-like domain-containing protein, partial [Desulfuromonadales bacterium]|nr:rhodanese-like domain-containing protein [Desulfuromonadales bacterium]
MNATVTPRELQRLLAGDTVTLIDVLLPEDFACRHIAGAGNACVYEMVFLERVAELVPNRERPVVVYDESGATLSASDARGKLERAGYRSVAVLAGGLRGWRAAGLAVETGVPAPPAPTVRDGRYRIDTGQSVLEWTGRNIGKRHYGRIALSGGEVVVTNGLPASGRLVLDMNT